VWILLKWLIKHPLAKSGEHGHDRVVSRHETSGSQKKKYGSNFFWTSCVTQNLKEWLCTWSLLFIFINLKIKTRSP
jgi:hypothetical protein